MRPILLCLLLLLPLGSARAEQPELVNHPFHTERDVVAYNYRCKRLLADLEARNADSGLQAFLVTAAAFTSGDTGRDDEYSVVNFATSSDPALIRLRKEIGLPPPPGGAIVRIYGSRDSMPHPIRRFFEDTVVNGITWSHRFIAIVSGDHSEEQTTVAISHELVHAYMSSYVGDRFHELPKWFKEGTALYISGGKTLYVSETDRGRNISWYTKEYNEYRTIFGYLSKRLGERRLAAFIKQVLDEESADESLRSLGIKDEDQLRAEALHWDSMRQVRLSGIMIGLVAVMLILVWRAHRRAVALYELEHAEEMIEAEDWRE